MSTRRSAFYLSAGTMLVLCVGMSWAHDHPMQRIAGFVMLLLVGLAVVLLWPLESSRRWQAAALLGLALGARLALISHPADSDINRYMWEGRLIRAGESPYAHVASAPEWQHLRDRYWQGMNQKGLRTIYPPLAQGVFAAVGGIWYHPVALKLLFIAFDVAVVGLLIALLSARAMPLRLAGLYAFNPVPLIGFAGEGHSDAMLLFFVLLAVWLRERQRPAWSWVALALAVQMKLVAVVLAPVFARRGGWRTAWVGAIIALLPLVVWIDDLPAWMEGVRHFGGDLAFNGSVHALAWNLLGDRPSAVTLCAAWLIGWMVWVALLHRDIARGVFWIFGGLIVLAPTVHYWYLSWALVFLPLFPSVAWMTLSGTMALYFLVQSNVLAGQGWGLPTWAQITIWTLFGAVLAREATIALRALLEGRRRAPFPPVQSIAVVLPVLNEGRALYNCLGSLLQMSPRPNEVIVVDGGSNDATRSIAEEFGAVVINSARGRGRQIAAGVARARSDVVLVLHADSTVEPEVSARIIAGLNANSAAVGGAVGQRFDADAVKLCAIEMLNEIRTLFFGISFGDQGQFFRRAALREIGGFPTLPLMEDVEFSLRARSAGPLLYQGGGIVSSDRRWRQEKWLTRCLTVLTITTMYRMRRGEGDQIAAALYDRYYSEAAGADAGRRKPE